MRMPKIFLAATAAILLIVGANTSANAAVISAEATATIKVTIKKSVDEYAASAQGDYTGLIVDCRGLGLQTAMSPVIFNTNGTKIYGHKNLDIDRIIEMGMVDYINDFNNVDRAGVNPLVVKAISLRDFNSNPIVSLTDSNRILIENHVTRFLQQLKVVFLYD